MKKFTTEEIRDLLNQVYREEISFSRMVDVMNEMVDETGLPMVPDDVSFRDALMWKCAYQLSLRGYQFKNPQLQDTEYCKFYWNQYCVQARANANAPDPDGMERLARIFTTLQPDYYQYSQDFAHLGGQGRINLNGIH